MAVERKTQGVGKRVRVNWNVAYSKAFLVAIQGVNAKKMKAAEFKRQKAAEIKEWARLKQQLADKKNGLLPELMIGLPKPKRYGIKDIHNLICQSYLSRIMSDSDSDSDSDSTLRSDRSTC